MLPCNYTGCILGRAPRTKETLPDFLSILGPGKIGLNCIVSVYPIFTNLPQVDGLSMDPRYLGRHNLSEKYGSDP